MPHTLYDNNAVSPDVHRLRALGGPLFNAALLVLSAVVLAVAPSNSIVWELAAWSAAAHGMMLLMSLAPVPGVDGGTLLKWTLVARAWPEEQAEAAARRLGWLSGVAVALLGLGLITLQAWIVGGLFALAGIIILGTAAGLIR
jgi:Zn-dependent protease